MINIASFATFYWYTSDISSKHQQVRMDYNRLFLAQELFKDLSKYYWYGAGLISNTLSCTRMRALEGKTRTNIKMNVEKYMYLKKNKEAEILWQEIINNFEIFEKYSSKLVELSLENYDKSDPVDIREHFEENWANVIPKILFKLEKIIEIEKRISLVVLEHTGQ